jgi:catechol 2,3-dioxygenase-like lactoylglutathione lyase family enzyme
MIVGVNHAQMNVPATGLPVARDFYLGFMGFKEIARPAVFTSEGIWMHAGNFELHIGLEDGVDRMKTRAHIAFEVTDIKDWRRRVEAKGWAIKEQPNIPGYERFHFRDPFGNNIELIQRQREGTTDEHR